MSNGLHQAREIARHANEEATFQAQKNYDQKAEPHSFVRDQLVLHEDLYFAGQNAKLSPRFTGPHHIIELKGETDVVIKMLNSGRKTTVHVNRLKPYHVPPEDVQLDDAPQIPPPAPLPQLPPRNSQNLMPPQLPPRNLEPYVPVAARTRSKNPQISAETENHPQPINLAGDGVQKICQQLIEETAD